MGSSYSVFIGPAIKCYEPKIVKSSSAHRRCPNSKCDNFTGRHVNTNFCPLCGTEVEVYYDDVPISYYRIMDECYIDDDLFMVLDSDMHYADNDTVIWTDNSGDHGLVMDHEENKFHEIDATYINTMMMSFRNKFRDEIEKIKEYYKHVEVQFMIFGYWM